MDRNWEGGLTLGMAPAFEGVAAVSALATHRGSIVPRVHDEIGRWTATARSISDPILREAALSALEEKQGNVEATAVFAILAPREQRPRALRAMSALQIAVDYLDTLGEQVVDDPLAAGQALHRSLSEAVSPGAVGSDWYRAYPQSEDDGYLANLVGACQKDLASLPAIETVLPFLQRAARRCGEGQSHTHADAAGAAEGLRAWAERKRVPGYLWWEIAAGASSSVAVHALIAAAADPGTTAEQAELIDAAYFPAIGAMTVLLDDLIDRAADEASGEHNYMRYYGSGDDAGKRLAFIAEQARSATAKLRRRRRHDAIVAGVTGFYLSDPAAGDEFGLPASNRVLESSGGTARLLRTTMRLRHHG